SRYMDGRGGFSMGEVVTVAERVDARGAVCPMPTIRLAQAIRRVPVDAVVELWTTDPGSRANMAAWCRNTGHELCSQDAEGELFRYRVRRVR
ncbi:MAG: sulfurtransferase TusA family protein, partial [Actinomycetota bacterium]